MSNFVLGASYLSVSYGEIITKLTFAEEPRGDLKLRSLYSLISLSSPFEETSSSYSSPFVSDFGDI